MTANKEVPVVRVGLVQLACSTDRAANVNKTIEKVREAAGNGANIVCLQELFDSQYFPQHVQVDAYSLAEPLPSPTSQSLQVLAKELNVVLIVPVFEEATAGVYFNSVLVFDAGGELLGKYRKTHIPDGPQYHEKFYFTPGNLGYPVWDTKFGRIGVGICWDEWFPEVARIFALAGAEILFYPSAIGSEPDRPGYSSADPWRTVIRGHGIANGVFVAAVNRVGTEGAMSFYGESFASDPFGEVLAQADSEEGIVYAELDRGRVKELRELFQFFRDRRVDTYQPLLDIVPK